MISQLPTQASKNNTSLVQRKFVSESHLKRYVARVAEVMMEPEEFLQHWDCTYKDIATVCGCSRNTVASWFCGGKMGKRPTLTQKRWLGAAHNYLLMTRSNQL